MTLEPGLAAAFRYTVTEADTAAALGSCEVSVLAAPRVPALAERATVAAAASTWSGHHHGRSRSSWTIWPPSSVGADLEVEAGLERVAAHRLQFALRLPDGEQPVASGRIIRVVDTAAFLRDAGAGTGAPPERAAGGDKAGGRRVRP